MNNLQLRSTLTNWPLTPSPPHPWLPVELYPAAYWGSAINTGLSPQLESQRYWNLSRDNIQFNNRESLAVVWRIFRFLVSRQTNILQCVWSLSMQWNWHCFIHDKRVSLKDTIVVFIKIFFVTFWCSNEHYIDKIQDMYRICNLYLVMSILYRTCSE